MKLRRSLVLALATIVLSAVVIGRQKSHTSKPRLPIANSQAECTALHGWWGPQGLLGFEMCVLPTSDGGKECFEDSDCQGSCLAPEYADKGSKAVGHCTHTDARFGCATHMRDGVVGATICVD